MLDSSFACLWTRACFTFSRDSMHPLSAYTSYYFYSSVFQGNMALLAFAAVFVVHKIQLLNSEIQMADQGIAERLNEWYTRDNVPMSHETSVLLIDLDALEMSHSHSVDPRLKDFSESNTFRTWHLRRHALRLNITAVRKSLKRPLYWTLSVIILSMILLPLSTLIHSEPWFIEWILVLITIVLNVISLTMSVRFMQRMV
jgi:hypothetical protein